MIPETLGALAKPCQDDGFLSAIEFAPAWGWYLGPDAVVTVAAVCRVPGIDDPLGDAEELGHLRDGISVPDSENRESPPPFEFGGRAVWSHAR